MSIHYGSTRPRGRREYDTGPTLHEEHRAGFGTKLVVAICIALALFGASELVFKGCVAEVEVTGVQAGQ